MVVLDNEIKPCLYIAVKVIEFPERLNEGVREVSNQEDSVWGPSNAKV